MGHLLPSLKTWKNSKNSWNVDQIMKQSRSIYGLLWLFAIIIALALFSYFYISKSSQKMQESIYKVQATSMQHTFANLIFQKQKSTIALGLSLANDATLMPKILSRDIPQNYYDQLIPLFNSESLYKNVWIKINDANGTTLYRSWTDHKWDATDDDILDIKTLIATKKPVYHISVNKYDLAMEDLIPIFDHDKFIGTLEIITHFNSITRQMQSDKTGAVILLDAKHKEQLQYPFTKMFLNDYYIANLDAPNDLQEYLRKHNPKNYLNNSFKVENGYLIVSYPIKDSTSNEIAYCIMFKKLSDLDDLQIQFFTFKLISLFILLSSALFVLFGSLVLIKNRKQKLYYRDILDSSSNIMIVNNGEHIVDANKVFFRYFYQYSSIEQFLRDHQCICDLFSEEEGYLHAKMGSLKWTDYILQHPEIIHKVKITYFEKTYYFIVTVSNIASNHSYNSIVLSDITMQENYQQQLLDLSIRDPLTGIYNRHFYNQKIEEEIQRFQRYHNEFSLIMFDIDHFKNVNDLYGHDMGDKVLIEYTRLISSTLRKTDIFCRIGGEEFVVILPHTSIDEAKTLAEKLRVQIEEHKMILPITMSFGVVVFKEIDNEHSILKRADKALYLAKERGRNRVIVGL